MSRLTIDADGWYTTVGDAQTNHNAEKVNEVVVEPLTPRSRSSSGSKESRATGSSSNAWINSVSDLQNKTDALTLAEKPAVQASSVPSRSRSSSSVVLNESAKTTNPFNGWTERSNCEKAEQNNPVAGEKLVSHAPSIPSPSRSRSSSEAGDKDDAASGYLSSGLDTDAQETIVENISMTDGASTSSLSSRASSDCDTKKSITTSISSNDWAAGDNDAQKLNDAAIAREKPADTASASSTTAVSTASSDASVGSSTSETPKRLRPRARSATLTPPALGIDPKSLVGKVLTHIRRSPGHPTVTLSFADGTKYQIRVDGYDPQLNTETKTDSDQSSRTCELEMDEVLLRMLEVPGRHVVDRAIVDCTHIRLADKAYERREWEQSWQQSHVAVAFKFAEERRWHCVWAMRSEYDERGCIFRTFDDVYLEALERQPPRSPQKKKKDTMRQPPTTPQKSPRKEQSSPQKLTLTGQSSPQKSLPKPPPSPTMRRSRKQSPNTPRKNKLGKTENCWRSDA